MLMLLALGVMSIALMSVIAVLVLAQKLLPSGSRSTSRWRSGSSQSESPSPLVPET